MIKEESVPGCVKRVYPNGGVKCFLENLRLKIIITWSEEVFIHACLCGATCGGMRKLFKGKGGDFMNIQIFGTKKCNDTKKAERFFKERGIKYQFIDMQAKGMSKGEFNSVAQVNGGLENMINWDGKDKDLLALIHILRMKTSWKRCLKIRR